MTSPLEILCGPNKPLRQEPPDAKEFAGLKRSARTRLAAAGNPAVSMEGRFDLAYSAACKAVAAALDKVPPPA